VIPLCPKCDERLFLVYLRDTEFDACPKCHGVWLDAGEIEAIMRETGATPDDAVLRSFDHPGKPPHGVKQLCPRCDTLLEEVSPDCPGGGTLVLDRCPKKHGVWFDAGELMRLLALFPETSCASKTIDYLHEILGDLKPETS
jgi:Zn-finger nucleic acid-binding protein